MFPDYQFGGAIIKKLASLRLTNLRVLNDWELLNLQSPAFFKVIIITPLPPRLP